MEQQENQAVETKEKFSFKETAVKVWDAFKNVAIVFSFLVNIVLVIVVFLSPGAIFGAKTQIAEPVMADLDAAFQALGDTTIETTVAVDHKLPISFDLPLQQGTDVILQEPVPLQVPATFFLPGGGGSIKGTVSLELPEGTSLPVNLDLNVPVDTSIPVEMLIPVEINLAQSGMGPAIDQLREVLRPYYNWLQAQPNSVPELLGQ